MLVALPDLCYEFDGDGTDAAGLGPAIPDGAYGTGLIGDGLTVGQQIGVSDDVGVDLTGDFTISFWKNLTTLALGAQPSCSARLRKTSTYDFLCAVETADGVSQITAAVSNLSGGASATVATTTGWKMFSFVRSSGIAQVYMNGVAIGDTGELGNYDGTDLTQITVPVNGTGVFDQLLIAARAMSAAELLYLYNSGDGIAYDDMDTGTAPSAPTFAAPVASQESIAYTLTPGDDGGLPITGYQVWRSDNGAAYYYYDNIDASATTYRVATGLRQYPVSLKIKAVNAAGASSFSNSQSVA